MFSNKLKICGKINKETLKRTDNKVFFTLNTRINNNDKYKSLVYVEFNKEIWDKINPEQYDEDLIITGEIQARKTKNNSPFIYLKTHNVILKSDKSKTKRQKEKAKALKNSLKWKEFFQDEDFQMIDISKVYLKEEEHMKGTVDFYTRTHGNTRDRVHGKVIVRLEDNGKYSLVMGFKEFVHCKLLDLDIKAYVTELSLIEFKEKYFKPTNSTDELEQESINNNQDNKDNKE